MSCSTDKELLEYTTIKQTSTIMKKILLIASCSLFLFGCNINPSKEARIQKLETEIQQTMDKVSNLENKVQLLEGINEQLTAKVLELENKQ